MDTNLMEKSSVQTFIEDLVKTILSMLKIALMSNMGIKKFKKKPNINDCIILGNGPSLKAEFESDLDLFVKKDCFAVNFFWKSEYYVKVKPKYYIIASTNYWSNDKIDSNNEGRQQTFNQIATLTTWDMILIVPAIAKRHKKWQEIILGNKGIKIEYINIAPIEGFSWFVNFCFGMNLGLPRPHNVLIPAIKVATDYEYKNIFIIGADHSWLKEIYVGNDNKVYLTQKHFYDNKSVPEVMYYGTSNRERTLADMLMKFVHTFDSYFVLGEYAKTKDVNIFNATKNSYIDAFVRRDIN